MVRIMPSIEKDDQNSSVFDRPIFKSLSCNLSYEKLPQQLIKISILKLDGSLFDVCVARNATVGEVKEAVEDVFRSSPKDEEDDISWFHVWGHFCLCHEEQKLLNDKVQIRNLGINDCDQLKFIQHLSINYHPTKQKTKKMSASSTPLSMPSLLKRADEKGKQSSIDHDTSFIDDRFSLNPCRRDDDENFKVPKFKFAGSLNSGLTYTKLKISTKKRFLGTDCWSRF